ncbi:MAG: RIP metalloprotease RseP [Tissierellales bacterium]|nr:RIP metalloprotease RseP [Tissierellales bacterium]MBN2827961.1 RIP metalloprotease RseP [Tissierellales bacterium]
MLTTVSSILIFSIVILIHELGHFLAARSVGIKVNEFSIGMGPVLFKKEGKETNYFIKAFPIGGYIKMEGEDDDSFSQSSFNSKTPLQRFKVIFMGPFMNFMLALLLFFILISFYGIAGTTVSYIDENSNEYTAGLRQNDTIIGIGDKTVYFWDDLSNEITKYDDKYTVVIKRNDEKIILDINQGYRYIVGISPVMENEIYTTKIEMVNMDFPADKAGLKAGDVILAINDLTMETWDEVRTTIASSKGDSLEFKIDRDGEIKKIILYPENQIMIGFYTEASTGLFTAFKGALFRTVFYVKLMFQLILMLFSGQASSDAIAGPVGIISMVGEAARLGIYPLMNLAAFISINLGFMNLLPIPALDGSRLMFILIEGIRGKRIPPEKEGYIHFVGFVFLMTLMFFVLYKDIIKLLN